MDLDRWLARGRGAGWRAAIELGAPAIDSVLRCVIEDPRWDRQVETRDEYYASILIALVADIQPIVDALAIRDPEEHYLARYVLIQLAWRGHLGARAAVVARVRAGAEDASSIMEPGDIGFAERVFALADRTLPPDEPGGPRLVRTSPDPDPDLGVAALLEIAAMTDDERKVRALGRVGELGHHALLPEAEAFLRSPCGSTLEQRRRHRERRGWCRYLEALPGAYTLPHARRWFHDEWPLSLAAEKILIRHAEPEDRLMLEQAGARALADHQVYRLCSVVEALEGLAASESIDLLCRVYQETDYAYARERACHALAAHRARLDVQALLVEALWDCESSTRAFACGCVDRDASAARLRELERDEFECDEVREAARAALQPRADEALHGSS